MPFIAGTQNLFLLETIQQSWTLCQAHETGDIRQNTGDRRLETGGVRPDMRLGTEYVTQEPRDRRRETGAVRQET